MDLEHLENTVRSLQPKLELVRSAAEYCIRNNKSNEEELAKILEKQFNGSHKDHKLAILMLVSQIFLQTSRTRDFAFLRTLSIRAKNFISDLAGIDDYRCSKQVASIMDKWAQEGIFVANFMKKLRESAAPIYQRIEKEEDKNRNEKSKYGKAFLMQMLDIKSMPCCDKIYDSYVANKKIEMELSTFYQECSKIDSEKPTEEAMMRAKDLVKVGEEYKEKLMKLIEDYHANYKILQESCKQQLSRLPPQYEI